MVNKRGFQSEQLRKLFLLCDEIFGKGDQARQQRLELAEYLLRRDISTFDDLDPAQVLRMLDVCEGYQLISHLKSM